MGCLCNFHSARSRTDIKTKGYFGRRTNLTKWNKALLIFSECTLKIRKKYFPPTRVRNSLSPSNTETEVLFFWPYWIFEFEVENQIFTSCHKYQNIFLSPSNTETEALFFWPYWIFEFEVDNQIFTSCHKYQNIF